MEEILGAHPINDDDFWGGTNPSDVSIDTMNSKEMMAGSNITELHTHKYKEPVPPKLLNKVPNVSEMCDAIQKCQLDPLDKFKDSNMLSKTNKVTHANGINLSSQENQDYNNQHDQQLMTRKHDGGQGYYNQSNPQLIAHRHNGGVEQVNTELVLTLSWKKRKNGFTNGLTTMIFGIITLTHLQNEMKWEAPVHLMLIPVFSTLPNPNITGNQRQEL